MHEVPSFQEEHCHLNIVMKTGDCLPWTKLFQPPHVGKQSLRVMSDCALVFVHSGCMRQGKSTCCTIMSKRPIFDSVLSSLGILGKENTVSLSSYQQTAIIMHAKALQVLPSPTKAIVIHLFSKILLSQLFSQFKMESTCEKDGVRNQ